MAVVFRKQYKVKPENLEELVEHLAELTVDVDGGQGDRVRIYCE